MMSNSDRTSHVTNTIEQPMTTTAPIHEITEESTTAPSVPLGKLNNGNYFIRELIDFTKFEKDRWSNNDVSSSCSMLIWKTRVLKLFHRVINENRCDRQRRKY